MARIEEGKVIFETGSEYELITRGKKQAIQIVSLSRWLSKYGGKFLAELQNINEENEGKSVNLMGNLSVIFDIVSVDALMEAFVLVTNCTADEAEEEFDIAVLIDAGMEIINGNPSFRNVVERFFSEPES